ncbi:ABC transporter ATP-binding protein [Flavivirga jejuensis]|uniref:Polysaccharide ABC transporter ATP-binding protein n=1 Tax=Flavivirga jejuensis TaxID=870487 RepID=A0ABT8WUY5_9FLAO|nr:polysaccharide ABC transporter ATP-binding protein [Flavivirga jejuensis]MDO5976677.1 polysaccharide ABC transporter ATP-binding protein [Flavivirga jejuensis]
MGKEIILKTENISKQYRLGVVGTGTIGHDLNRWWYKIRGKEDPYLKVGDSNDRSTNGYSDYVWALQDISFDVEQGEVLGVIGKNGAGKSTLLKILSKVTTPTTGEIKTKGRIASLLEVGTGFHPEMTGKENIFLNGAILGMTKKEIQYKLDEIIEFSGCRRYIDTPVKRYSSGMTVRLAFAVAAHLDPDILVIDEVLAVGDAEFQNKAIGKMQEISGTNGRTVLFVSHNMAAIKTLCTKAIVLEHGKVKFKGTADEAVDFYLKNEITSSGEHYSHETSEKSSDILGVSILDSENKLCSVFAFNHKIYLKIKIRVSEKHLPVSVLSVRVIDQFERPIFTSEINLKDYINSVGLHSFNIELPYKTLTPNDYRIHAVFHIPNQELISNLESVVSFNIEETGSELYKYAGLDYGCVVLDCKWNKI